jgi:cell division protein FtsW (lipid II flippase)
MFLAPELVFFLLLFALAGFAVIGVYMLPSLIAFARGHNNLGAIFMLNLLLGWTFVGWAAALVWSLTDNVRLRQRIYFRY